MPEPTGNSKPIPLWRFRCEADQLPDGQYRVEIVSDKGKRITRIGYHPLWELIRALRHHESNTFDEQAFLQAMRDGQASITTEQHQQDQQRRAVMERSVRDGGTQA